MKKVVFSAVVTKFSTADQLLIDNLHQSLQKEDVESISKYLATDPKAPMIMTQHKFNQGNMALHYAVLYTDLELFKLLVSMGSDPNAKNDYGWTCLMLAAYHGKIDSVRYLLTVPGMKISEISEFGFTALTCAVRSGSLITVRALLGSKTNINKLEQQGPGPTALMIACHMGKLSIVGFLLKKGAEPNAQCRLNGWTALMYACNNYAPITIIKMLVEHSADIELRTWNGLTALDIAVYRKNNDVADYLKHLNNPVSAGLQTSSEDVYRHEIFDAILNEDILALKTMVEEDREVLVERDISGRTPLMVAVLEGNDNLVEFLLSKGANVEVVDLSGKSVLHYACMSNNVKICEQLTKKGAFITMPIDLEGRNDDIQNELRKLSTNPEILKIITTCVKFRNTLQISTDLKSLRSFSERSAISWLQKLFRIGSKPSSNSLKFGSISSATGQKQPKMPKQRKKSKNIPTFDGDSNDLDIRSVDKSELSSISYSSSKQGSLRGKDSIMATSPLSTESESPAKETIPAQQKIRSNSAKSSQTAKSLDTSETCDALLSKIGLEKHFPLLKRKGIISIKDLITITYYELEQVGIKSEDERTRILKLVEEWKTEQKRIKIAQFKKEVDDMITGKIAHTTRLKNNSTAPLPNVVRIPSAKQSQTDTRSFDISDKYDLILQLKAQKRAQTHRTGS